MQVHELVGSQRQTRTSAAVMNPTLDTLWRYAAAVGRRLVLTTEAILDTRPAAGKAQRVEAGRKR